MSQDAYDAGYDAAIEGKGPQDLPRDYAEDHDKVVAWYAGHSAGVKKLFLDGAIRMLKGRGYTREQITRAMEEAGA